MLLFSFTSDVCVSPDGGWVELLDSADSAEDPLEINSQAPDKTFHCLDVF